MRSFLLSLFILVVLPFAAAGCGDSPVDGSDGGASVDAASPRADAELTDGSLPPGDAGPMADGGPPGFDSGPPEDCSMPGAVETVACGSCGTVERFCTAGGTWAYGVCEGEGVCAPGTTDLVACGNCGTQAARCTSSCMWEMTGACSGEGECAPGAATRSGDGCPPGATRDVVCSDACAFVPMGMCAVDGCPMPGISETVACGTMCGTQERFCTAARTWDYGACGGGGVCTPGTTGTEACGRCGMRATRCSATCAWSSSGACTGEGMCTPGEVRRTATGCPAGQTQAQRCGTMCGWETTEACRADMPVDVMILLDVTGSHGMRVRDQVALIRSRLVTALLGLTNVAVGVAYYADFPIDPYGTSTDRPFEGGIEPSLSFAPISTELGTIPTMHGNDGPESGIEALAVLTGATPPTSARALVCSSGRVAGGCWRPGARRVVIIWTDAANHNGPDPASTGLFSPYSGISPAPASWTAASTLGAMRAQGVELMVLYHRESIFGSTDASSQASEMVADLTQPAGNVINATYDASTAPLGSAFDSVVARVRVLAGM